MITIARRKRGRKYRIVFAIKIIGSNGEWLHRELEQQQEQQQHCNECLRPISLCLCVRHTHRVPAIQ